MTLLEATQWIKDKYNLDMAPNTLRKACASLRLRGTRIGEGITHIRRTQWEVTIEDLQDFLQKEYHPRPKSKGKKKNNYL